MYLSPFSCRVRLDSIVTSSITCPFPFSCRVARLRRGSTRGKDRVCAACGGRPVHTPPPQLVMRAQCIYPSHQLLPGGFSCRLRLRADPMLRSRRQEFPGREFFHKRLQLAPSFYSPNCFNERLPLAPTHHAKIFPHQLRLIRIVARFGD